MVGLSCGYLKMGLRFNLLVMSQKGRRVRRGIFYNRLMDNGIGGLGDKRLRRRLAVEEEVETERDNQQEKAGGSYGEIEDSATMLSLQMLDCVGYLLLASSVFSILLESREEVGKIKVVHLLLTV